MNNTKVLALFLAWAGLRELLDEEFTKVWDEFYPWYISSINSMFEGDFSYEDITASIECYIEDAKKVIDNGFLGECAMLDYNPRYTVLEYDL